MSATQGVSAPEVAAPTAGTSLSALLAGKLSAARGAHAVPAMPGVSAPVVVAAVASSSLSALQDRPATSDSDSARSLVNSGAPSREHWETPATIDWTLGEGALPPVATVRSELSTSVHDSTRELRRALLDDICKEAGVRAEAKAREETRVWLLRETRRVITNVGRLCMASGAVLMTDALPHGVLQSAALPSAALQSAMLPRVELLSTTLLQSAALLHGTRALLRALLRSAALLHGTPSHATLPPRLPHAAAPPCACRPPSRLRTGELSVVQSPTTSDASASAASVSPGGRSLACDSVVGCSGAGGRAVGDVVAQSGSVGAVCGTSSEVTWQRDRGVRSSSFPSGSFSVGATRANPK